MNKILTKRIFDVMLSLALLPLFLSLMVGVGILVFFNLGSPVIYSQKRIGYKNKEFTIYKFRSMLLKKDDSVFDDAKRLTSFGRLLRKTSLDELPEIFNVMMGSMSWVGPRPLLKDYLELYDDNQVKRHNVLPGLTGWAQVNGRNLQSWEERFDFDLEYVQKQSFLFDLKIIFKTIVVIFKQNGVENSSGETLKPFKGSKR